MKAKTTVKHEALMQEPSTDECCVRVVRAGYLRRGEHASQREAVAQSP